MPALHMEGFNDEKGYMDAIAYCKHLTTHVQPVCSQQLNKTSNNW